MRNVAGGLVAGPRARPRRARAWRSPWLLLAAVAVVSVFVAGFAVAAMRPANPGQGAAPDAAAVASAVTSLPQSELDAIGPGGYPTPLKPIAGSPSAKPVVVYVGAEYCPYCAAERWSLVQALGRFGTFQGLKLTTSSSSDRFPDTPTFSFHGSSYYSPSVDFAGVEVADRESRPLDPLPAALGPIVKSYDPNVSLPFLYVNGRYVAFGSNYMPDLLHGMTWNEVATRLHDPSSPVARGVVGNANQLAAGICQVTGGQPATVCSSAAVRSVTLPGQ